MKILTWNINGIRASKVPLKELFDGLDADIICLQETKVTRDLLDERSAIVDGYNAYYSFSKARSGYSGVATYVKDSGTPWKAEEGLSGGYRCDNEEDNIGCYGDQSDFSDEELQSLDCEGRTIITQHKIMSEDGNVRLLTVINVYCPRADPDRPEREEFKMRFYQLLQKRAEALLKNNSSVIVLGDVNTSHRRIDHCDPDEAGPNFELRPGRVWLNQFLWDPEAGKLIAENTSIAELQSGGNFVDTFRYLHPNQRNVFSCWSSATNARVLNYGTRIDYIFADMKLGLNSCEECLVLTDVQGSDHCPVKATFNCEIIPSKQCPPLCTKYMPEFTGKQQKLSVYFTKASSNGNQNTPSKGKILSDSSSPFKQSESVSVVTPIKRQGSQKTQKGAVAKKLKKDSKQPSSGKQASLKAFFGSKDSKTKTDSKETSENTTPVQVKNSEHINNSQSKDVLPAKTDNDNVANSQSQSVTINTWKNLLKPRAAPLCKGHNEPCVARTVKKEGPTKGRIFYVCTRPEGLKSNPEARCEHFEWLDKKKR